MSFEIEKIPVEAGTGKETGSALEPQKMQPCGHLDLSSMRFVSDIYHIEQQNNKFALF